MDAVQRKGKPGEETEGRRCVKGCSSTPLHGYQHISNQEVLIMSMRQIKNLADSVVKGQPTNLARQGRRKKMSTPLFIGQYIVVIPQDKLEDDGIVAFQLVDYSFNFFGTVVTGRFDSKIMENGQQFVIGGDGFIEHGLEITGQVL